jgi:hypothetical protein
VAEVNGKRKRKDEGMTSLSHPDRTKLALRGPAAVTALAILLTGCAAGNFGSSPASQRYRCEQGIEFSVKFVDDSAVIDSSRGYNVLFRDAGGQDESQPVYSNAVVRAEFGLGASGREAVLRYPLLPLVVRCVRD